MKNVLRTLIEDPRNDDELGQWLNNWGDLGMGPQRTNRGTVYEQAYEDAIRDVISVFEGIHPRWRKNLQNGGYAE